MSQSDPEFPTEELLRRSLERPHLLLMLGDWLKRHLLLLHVIYERDDRVGQALYTGSLFQLGSDLYWVTAAHCLENLAEARVDDAIRIHAARWLDHHTDTEANAIPIGLESLEEVRIPSDFLDVAAVPLVGNARALLERSDVYHPLSEDVWAHNSAWVPKMLVAMGYPNKWFESHIVQSASSTVVQFHAFHACLAIEPVADPLVEESGDPAFWSRSDCLYGYVALPTEQIPAELDSIVGMSGGPVFSLESDSSGRLRYRLYGVQCSWLAEHRAVRAERVERVVHLIETYREWKARSEAET